jgi:hypothetical protein
MRVFLRGATSFMGEAVAEEGVMFRDIVETIAAGLGVPSAASLRTKRTRISTGWLTSSPSAT